MAVEHGLGDGAWEAEFEVGEFGAREGRGHVVESGIDGNRRIGGVYLNLWMAAYEPRHSRANAYLENLGGTVSLLPCSASECLDLPKGPVHLLLSVH